MTGGEPAGLGSGKMRNINGIVKGLKSDLSALKESNRNLSERCNKQRVMINQIFLFLAGIFGNFNASSDIALGNGAPQDVPQRRHRHLIKDAQPSEKEALLHLSGDDDFNSGIVTEDTSACILFL